MYIMRTHTRINDPQSRSHNTYAFLIKLTDGLPRTMRAYRIPQLPMKPMIFKSRQHIKEVLNAQGIHRIDLWLKTNDFKIVRLRSSAAIPGLGNLAREYRVATRSILGASSMLRKSLVAAGYPTVAQLIYEDVGKVLERMKLEYDDKANRIAGSQGKVRRIRQC